MMKEKYSTVVINDEIALSNAGLLSDVEFEISNLLEKGQFNLEDVKKLQRIENELNELRKKQVKLIGSGKKEY